MILYSDSSVKYVNNSIMFMHACVGHAVFPCGGCTQLRLSVESIVSTRSRCGVLSLGM